MISASSLVSVISDNINVAAAEDTNHKPRITIMPATPPAFPAVATADLLAFSGMSGEPISKLISPLRRDLVRCGAHPRHWPDFQRSIDTLEKAVRDGKVMVMAIVEDASAPVPADGATCLYGRGEQSKGSISIGGVTGVTAGLARLRPPTHIQQALLARRSRKDRLWGDYFLPVAKNVQKTVYGEYATGTDFEFVSIFKGETARVRKQTFKDDDYWHLEMLFVHPAYQGIGVGRALLEHCQALAESANPLAFPYPSLFTPKSGAHSRPPTSSNYSVSIPTLSARTSSDEVPNYSHVQSNVVQTPRHRKVRILLEASQAGTPVYARLGFRILLRCTVVYKGEHVSWPVMLWESNVSD